MWVCSRINDYEQARSERQLASLRQHRNDYRGNVTWMIPAFLMMLKFILIHAANMEKVYEFLWSLVLGSRNNASRKIHTVLR
jgi:hypothetical protein